jgi:glycine betaine/proline transport system ATP-binding protein
MQHNEVSTLMVVNSQCELLGMIDATDAIELIKSDREKQAQGLDGIVQRDVPTASIETPLRDLLDQFAQTALPIAVVDEHKRLRGVVIRGSVLAAMAGTGVA